MDNRKQQNAELEILTQAIEAFGKETGIQIKIKKTEVGLKENNNFQADALITIGPDNLDAYVEIKRHAQHANLGVITNQVQRLPGRALFVADYINPKMAERLKQENIQFIDTAGNGYINLNPIYILITGKKQNKEHSYNIVNNASRAFEPKGLMVTYAILTDPDLLNRTYREIAITTNVARGTVGSVINALKAGRYILDEARTANRKINNYQKLLDRWVEAWPEKLKPKLFSGTFIADDPCWWKDVNIEKYDGYWGGETAGALYTNYLKPEVATVYIPKKRLVNFISDMRLKKAGDLNRSGAGKVQIFTPFWPNSEDENCNKEDANKQDESEGEKSTPHIQAGPGLANPVLVYADLIATGDRRNISAAEIIYNERIA